MSERRKIMGKRLQRARRKAGYETARAFAEAIGVGYISVARTEAGHDAVSDGVFAAVESGLSLPAGIIRSYLRGGDEALLERVSPILDS